MAASRSPKNKDIIRAESSRIQKSGKRYNGFTNQQNILSHINGLKTKWILIASLEHVLMAKSLKMSHQIFQASKGFSRGFNKHGKVNGSVNNIWLGKQFNQILCSWRNDSTNVQLQEQFNQYMGRQMVQPNYIQFKARKKH